MQDQVEKKEQAMRKKDTLWGGIALLILFVTLVAFSIIVGRAPKAEWRNAYTSFPWEAAGVCIDEAEAVWTQSKGDARMELRTYSFPSCRIKLDRAEGSGYLSIRFFNHIGTQIGDRIRISYNNGQFESIQGNSVQSDGKEVKIRVEDGFKTADSYKLHQINEREDYWKVEVTCYPDGGTPIKLGHLSVIPHDL